MSRAARRDNSWPNFTSRRLPEKASGPRAAPAPLTMVARDTLPGIAAAAPKA
jgi:hypothetical protein